jgi:hypothetical protein
MSTLLGKRKRASAAIPTKPGKVLKNKETKASKTKPISQAELEDEDESQDEETSASEADSDSGSEQILDPQEIFRRHFEAQFKPLPVVAQKPNPDLESEDEDEDEDEEEWDGLSENAAADEDTKERNNGVQVVEHVSVDSRTVGMSKAEARAFMVSFSLCLLFNYTSLRT